MSKERLEEIRKRLVLLHSAVDVDDETKNYIFKDLKVEWLVEQVQELDRENKQIKEAYKDRESDIDFYQKMLGIDFEDVAIELPIERIQGDKIRILEQQNKRYREAREIIEQVYKESYVRNAYGYEDGYLDGLDTAINIIDEALEESS